MLPTHPVCGRRFGWKGGGGGGTGFWLETTDENNYGFEIEFDSNL